VEPEQFLRQTADFGDGVEHRLYVGRAGHQIVVDLVDERRHACPGSGQPAIVGMDDGAGRPWSRRTKTGRLATGRLRPETRFGGTMKSRPVESPTPARIDVEHWHRRLAELARRHGVPGATLGILRLRPGQDDELAEVAYGVLNKETGVETTTDSVFQIGSISKVWTATVAMRLIDDKLLDLDAPIQEVLPALRLADPVVAGKVTMRHLLTHTSGIDGDVFTDTGRGDDCLEKYVAHLAEEALIHPLGGTWSYCNSGFSLAGRVIEEVTGRTWDEVMRERLFAPLGLVRTGTLPEEALLRRAAVGHVDDGTGTHVMAPRWHMPRSLGPAGLINSTAAEVLAFARMHLAAGLAADGTRVLTAGSAAEMVEKQADLPDKHTLGDSWGIGWIRDVWDGRQVIGHDGSTIGQNAFLRILPSQGLAVALLTNGGGAHKLYLDLYREIFAEIAGVEMRHPLGPPAEPVAVDTGVHEGTYERVSTRMEVLASDEHPVLRVTITGKLAELTQEPPREYVMVPVEPNLYVVQEARTGVWMPLTFYALPTGERYVHFGARATPKVA
jgi:CubicO group peptidase (beta-lactamase class C family)